MNNTACQQGQTRVKVYLSGAAQAATTYFCASLSEGPESNYRIQSGNGKYMSHAQPHRLRFEICNFPLDPDKAFVVPVAQGMWAQELTWSYHYIYCYAAMYAICFAMFWFTEQIYQLKDTDVPALFWLRSQGQM